MSIRPGRCPRPLAGRPSYLSFRGEGERRIERAVGKFHQEVRDPLGDPLGHGLPLGRRGGAGISRAGVGGQEMPGPGDLDPAFFDCREPAGANRPGVRLVEGDQIGEMGQSHACFHLAGVVVFLLEDRGVSVGRHLVPVAEEQVDRRGPVQLAEHPLQVVAAVAVEEQGLANAMSLQRFDQIGDDPAERRGVQVHGQGKLHLVGLGAVGDGRQQEHPRPPLAGQAAGAGRDGLDLEGVGSVRQVKVVRFGRSQRQHRDLVGWMGLDMAVIDLCESPGLHGQLSLSALGLVSLGIGFDGWAVFLAPVRPGAAARAIARGWVVR